jgi:hypothetical protein
VGAVAGAVVQEEEGGEEEARPRAKGKHRMDAETCRTLQHAMLAESRSFLQYVSDAFPWTTPDELTALAKLQDLVAEEREGVQAIAEFLSRHKQPLPYLGSYPMSFTTMNFVSLEHLLPILIREERRAISERERELAGLKDAEAESLLRGIVAMKRRHLQFLQEMSAAHPETHSTVPSRA